MRGTFDALVYCVEQIYCTGQHTMDTPKLWWNSKLKDSVIKNYTDRAAGPGHAMTTEQILRTMRRRTLCTKKDNCTECCRFNPEHSRNKHMLQEDLRYVLETHGTTRGWVWFMNSLNPVERVRFESITEQRPRQHIRDVPLGDHDSA